MKNILAKAVRTALPGILCLVAFAAVALTAAANAQVTPEQQSAIRSSCRSDFMSKCSGITPGGKEALECLQKNVATLSGGCKTAVSATLPKAEPKQETKTEPVAPKPAEPAAATPAPAAAPATAAPTAAAPAKPAAPKAAAKPAAKPAAAPAQPTAAQQQALKQYCAADVMAHCQGTAGKITLECLQRNVPSLSPDCQKVVTTTMPNRGPAVVAVPPPVVAAPPPRPVAPASPLILKACAREIVLHCRGIEPGQGRIAACLNARIASGVFVGPRCKGAMKLSDALD